MAPSRRAVTGEATHAPDGRAAARGQALDLGVLFQDTADGVCAVDPAGRVALWNRSAERIVGYTGAEVLGRLCCHVFVGSDGLGAPLCYNGCHPPSPGDRWAASRRFGLTTRAKVGTPVRLVIDALPLHDARGERSAVLHLFRTLAPAGPSGSAPAGGSTGAEALLTPRELEVLRLIAAGASTRAIAARLTISLATVRNHVQSLLGKLDVHSRLEAAAYAVRHGALAGGAGPDAMLDDDRARRLW
jgi:DNA-binding CsgD family transcriptional regulator